MHEAQARQLGLLVEKLEQRVETGTYPIHPPLVGVVGRARTLASERQGVLDSRQQAAAATLEESVQRLARDAGPLDDVLDGRCLRTAIPHEVHRRREDPHTLSLSRPPPRERSPVLARARPASSHFA